MTNNFGLNDTYDYIEISIDSLDASFSFDSNSLKTDTPVFGVGGKGPIEKIKALKIISLQVPYTWYNINSINNRFGLYENGIFSNIVEIMVGTYTPILLKTSLENALNLATTNNLKYYVSIDSLSNKFIITSFTNTLQSPVANTTIPFYFKFGEINDFGNNNPRISLGFGPSNSNQSTILNSVIGTNTLNTFAIIPPYAMNIDRLYIYVNSLKIGTDMNFYLPLGAQNLGGGKNGPQLCKIPIGNCLPGDTIVYTDPDPQKWFAYDLLQSLSFFDLFFSLGNSSIYPALSLNGRSFSAKIGILVEK
jgi:hypothetical protein